jgi:ATP-dependent helicase/nuclease subunit A
VWVDWPVGERRPAIFAWLLSQEHADPASERWREDQKARDLAEERSLLYVAMTRAREWLIVSGTQRRSAPSEGAVSWYQAMAEVAGVSAQAPWADPATPAPTPAMHGALTLLRPPRQHLGVGVASVAPTAAQAFGNAFHEWMERLTRAPAEERPHLLTQCADPAVASAVAKVLWDSPAARFFSTAVLTARDEVEMVGAQAQLLRPDRIVRMPEGWWVLDYKTADVSAGVHPAMIEQLRAYRLALARALGSAEPIHTAIIDREGRVHCVDAPPATPACST